MLQCQLPKHLAQMLGGFWLEASKEPLPLTHCMSILYTPLFIHPNAWNSICQFLHSSFHTCRHLNQTMCPTGCSSLFCNFKDMCLILTSQTQMGSLTLHPDLIIAQTAWRARPLVAGAPLWRSACNRKALRRYICSVHLSSQALGFVLVRYKHQFTLEWCFTIVSCW